MSEYYQDCLNKIKNWIHENKYEQARESIMQELNMPYIPSEFEKQLHELLQECPVEPSHHWLDDEKIREYLNGDEKKQIIALNQLANQNIRLYLEEVQHVFDCCPSPLVRISLMEILANQQVSEAFDITLNGYAMEFIPSAMELPMDSEGVLKAIAILKDWLENENPSLLNMCQECVIKEAYLRLPFTIDEDESEGLAYSILRYVSSLLGIIDEMNCLLCEKNVAQIGTFDLLLYSNNI